VFPVKKSPSRWSIESVNKVDTSVFVLKPRLIISSWLILCSALPCIVSFLFEPSILVYKIAAVTIADGFGASK